MEYRIAVRRRFLPFWKIYLVIGHQTEVFGSTGRLVLTFADGHVLAVPGIHRRPVRVYPEYQRIKESLQIPSEPVPSGGVELIQEE